VRSIWASGSHLNNARSIPIASPLKELTGIKGFNDRAVRPICRLLTQSKIGPNWVTLFGVLVTCGVPLMMVQGHWMGAGLWLLAAGFFDILDGSLARFAGKKSKFGAFWDSTLDRISEAVVFGGFILYYYQHQQLWELQLAFSVSILAFLVSYTRARAEGLGIDCEVGVLARPGRVLLLSFGFLASCPTLALGVVGVLTLITVVQRVVRVWVKSKALKS